MTTQLQRLSQFIAMQEKLRQRGALRPEGVEALVEACFRVALHPDTPADRSLHLLRFCTRQDGANPKPFYHIARIYFRHGAFDLTGKWLEAAARRCSTSHRIWTHIALLQRELNEQQPSTDKFEPNGLELRAQSVLQMVQAGVDSFEGQHLDFQPPISRAWLEARKRQRENMGYRARHDDEDTLIPAVPRFQSGMRLLKPGRCRWSGVHDLVAEDLLGGRASAHLRSKILRGLKAAARLATTRPGGIGGFVVLAIQWCVSGYPAKTMRTLKAAIGQRGVPASLALLDHVLDLFEMPEATLAKALSDSLQAGRLPSLLAATIHQRRLLSVPFEPRMLAKWRAGSRLLGLLETAPSSTIEAQASEVTKALLSACNTTPQIRAAKLPDDELDTPGPPLTPVEAASELAALRSTVDELVALVQPARATDASPPKAWVKAAVEACEMASDRVDALFFRTASVRLENLPPTDHKEAQALRKTLNAILYLEPLKPGGDEGPSDPGWTTSQARFAQLFASSDAGEERSTFEKLAAWSQEAANCDALINKGWETGTTLSMQHKKEPLGPDDLARCAAVMADVAATERMAAERLKEITDLRASGAIVQQAQIDQVNALEVAFRKLSSQQGRFRKRFQGVPVSSPVATAVAATGAAPERSTAPAAENPPAPAVEFAQAALIEPPADADIRTRLSFAMEAFQRQVRQRFTAAVDTFAPYGSAIRNHGAFAVLQSSAQGRLAEALFRTRATDEALDCWRRMLREDRLNLACLQNVAVALTHTTTTGTDLAAWRDFCEQTYFAGVLHQTAQHGAAQRVEFHRAFAGAVGPMFMQPEPPNAVGWPSENLDELLPFLESPGRVRHFVRHLLLAWWNERLRARSAVIVLGTSREDSQKTRETAHAKLAAFADHCATLLPRRVAGSFPELVRSQLDQALKTSATSRHAHSRDPAYDADHKAFVAWIEAVCKVKYHLYTLILHGKDDKDRLSQIVSRAQSFDFLLILTDLDRVPLDTSPGTFEDIAQKFRGADPDIFLKLMDKLRQVVLKALAEYLMAEDGDEFDRKNRARQMQLLLTTWCHDPITRDSVALAALCLKMGGKALEAKDSKRAVACALAALTMDSRVSGVASNAIGLCAKASELNSVSLPIDSIAQAVRGWLDRALPNIDDDIDDPDEQPLTTEDYNEVRAVARNVLPRLWLKALPGGETASHGTMENTLMELAQRHPWVQPGIVNAYIIVFNRAGQNQDPAGARRLLGLMIEEAQRALNRTDLSKDEREGLTEAIQKGGEALKN